MPERAGGTSPLPAGDAVTGTEPAEPTHEAETSGVAVDYAGLVLLHPFLPRLFERTGILEERGSRIGADAMSRAAALLSYAARGTDDPFEFECGFIKVLLGLRLDAALPVASGTLSEGERGEADDLLASVVGHWRVLKHTSVEGLRSAFLQRSGLLTTPDDRAWHLRVEPSAFDVLLDRLPWSISTVKLPWMIRPLFTEWMSS